MCFLFEGSQIIEYRIQNIDIYNLSYIMIGLIGLIRLCISRVHNKGFILWIEFNFITWGFHKNIQTTNLNVRTWIVPSSA